MSREWRANLEKERVPSSALYSVCIPENGMVIIVSLYFIGIQKWNSGHCTVYIYPYICCRNPTIRNSVSQYVVDIPKFGIQVNMSLFIVGIPEYGLVVILSLYVVGIPKFRIMVNMSLLLWESLSMEK